MKPIFCTFLFVLTSLPVFSQPTPEEFLGYPVGADFKLARWDTIAEYVTLVGEASDRVQVEEVGRSTEDLPYLLVTIAAPDVIENIDHYRQLQRLVSHPNEIPEGQKQQVLDEAKSVILVACSLHSTEIGASQMSMELLYNLATKNDPHTNHILENCIILLVPSANPDGINHVVDWYNRSLGTPWEGRGMPWLYQKYTGHDNNRDWFMVTQQETRILTNILYHEWYPGIVFDIHQMGNRGVRFIIPPYYDPLNPNIHPLINESLKMIGGHMATDLASDGKTGVASNAKFDMWWHGGNRSTPYRHNIIGILSEAASARLASPIFQQRSELRESGRGLMGYDPLVNHADPWPGGWWTLRDIIDYELIACDSLFTLAARYRDKLNHNYMQMAEDAIRLGSTEPPYAYVIPQDQRDRPTAWRLLNVLHQGGVRIEQTTEPFSSNGTTFPAGTPIIRTAQPYRNHILDLLEPQVYPERVQYAGGPPETPYDVAGWTLSYQMGVETIRIDEPYEFNTRTLMEIASPESDIAEESDYWLSTNQTTNDFILMNRCFREGYAVSLILQNEGYASKGDLLIHDPDGVVREWGESLGLALQATEREAHTRLAEIIPPRIGLYHPWIASKDEGWTRFVLEQFEFDYRRVHNDDIRAGRLNNRYDVILFPDIGGGSILHGMAEGTTAPEYTGGIGRDGVMNLQQFAREGGRILFLDSSTSFAIESFGLPVERALEGIPQDDFFCPGSILRLKNTDHALLATGMPEFSAGFFARSYAFEPTTGTNRVETVTRYDDTVTLLSGWIRGEDHIADKAAVVSVTFGKGSIVLYGFRVQHRAQPHGAFRLLFNGMVLPNR